MYRIITLAFAVFLIVVAWKRNANWDEFYFLSHVHAHVDGRLDQAFQTTFVHAFQWLVLLPGNEMEQIFGGRLVITLFFATTLFSLYKIADALAGRSSARIAVLAYLCSGFVIAHGTSFRADPIATACLMGALAIMISGRISPPQMIAIGTLSAMALLVTAKAVLFFPAYLGAMFYRCDERLVAVRLFFSCVFGLALAALLYMLHAYSVPTAMGNETATRAKHAFGTTLLNSGLFPRAEVFALWALLSVGPLVLVAVGLLAPGTGRERMLRVSFLLPLVLSFLFYRNAYPYFFAFVTPPTMVVVAVGARRIERGPLLTGLLFLMLATGLGQAIKATSEDAAIQRQTIAEVHRLFPTPVYYIDHNAMIASFPREVFFMSTWGLARYRAEGEPVMADLIQRTEPPLLLANRWALKQAMGQGEIWDHPLLLLPEDQEILRTFYVHYSGVIWLAGRNVSLDTVPRLVSLPFPGNYILKSSVPLMINGVERKNGAVIEVLEPISVLGPEGHAFSLVIDTPGVQRDDPLPDKEIYSDFWRL